MDHFTSLSLFSLHFHFTTSRYAPSRAGGRRSAARSEKNGLGTAHARLGAFTGFGTERATPGTFRGLGIQHARLDTFRGFGTERARLGFESKF